MEHEPTIAWTLFKTLVFTLLVPGTVGVLVPHYLVTERGGSESLPALSWRWVGFLPVVAGSCLYLVCAWHFAVTGLGTPAPIDMPRRLVVRGPYRFVRNPMYVGVAWFVVGQAVLFCSWAVLAYIASIWMVAHLFVVFYEEPTLRRKFGAEYEEYSRRVARWFPLVSAQD